MFVRDQMSPHPITITPESSITQAERVMRENNIRHLPVINPAGVLLGLLTRTAMEQILPSRLTTLSVYELHYQLDKITVREAMIRNVVTVAEDVPIEQAARIMWEKKIGCLPVMRGDRLAGIITDIDLMRTMLDLLGARQPGIRVTVKIPDRPGELAKIASAVSAEGGGIYALGTLPSDEPLKWWALLKVRFVDQDCLIHALKQIPDLELLDVRTE